jgi:hypothetical protein
MKNRYRASRTAGPHGIYATKFPLAEFPMSEGGNWIGGDTVGLDWSDLGTI